MNCYRFVFSVTKNGYNIIKASKNFLKAAEGSA